MNVKGETQLKVLFNNFVVPHAFCVVCSKQNNLCGRDLRGEVWFMERPENWASFF